MNPSQFVKIGLHRGLIKTAIAGIQCADKDGALRSYNIKQFLSKIIESPETYTDDKYFGKLAQELIEDKNFILKEPIGYKIWGELSEHVAEQMKQTCSMPNAVHAAVMADNHSGYGIPIGGVLALDNVISPYAVGVDIACRMKLSIIDLPIWTIKDKFNLYKEAIEKGTRFGVGALHEKPQEHPVLDQNWNITKVTRENKDKARVQLGTSGSGNHFIDVGIVTIDENCSNLNLQAGEYVAIMTHSGSRGVGASVCNYYSTIAQQQLQYKYADFGRLAWLNMDKQEGQEYFLAMNLMGDYAAANHDIIHKLVTKYLGATIISGVENHHNFCWLEEHNGKKLYVHRKGATPAGVGVLGVIPGSMASPAFIVKGKGNIDSLNSASHGAGRLMSRTKAKEKFTWKSIQNTLAKRGITVLSAGADESPGAYKDIHDVMNMQSDLVEIIAKFEPKIVKMADDGHSDD